MLLKVGLVMMAFALAFAGAVAAVALKYQPPGVAAVKAAQRDPTQPLERTDPGIKPWREGTTTFAPPEETRADDKPGLQPRSRPKREPEHQPKREPKPVARPEARLGPPSGARVVRHEPTRENTGAAHAPTAPRKPSHHGLPDGAIMGLTIKAIGIQDAPVFNSVDAWALEHGVGHPLETSMPWSDTPQRNVYLAGHKLGFPGTGSYHIFYRLDELRGGDEILLKDRAGKSYRYRVTETFVAAPWDSWVMGQIRGRDMVTLQTCTGPNWDRRLIVRADRV